MADKAPLDDWEEVADNYSVLSLSSEDEEAVVIPSPKRETAPAARQSTPPKPATEAAPKESPKKESPSEALMAKTAIPPSDHNVTKRESAKPIEGHAPERPPKSHLLPQPPTMTIEQIQGRLKEMTTAVQAPAPNPVPRSGKAMTGASHHAQGKVPSGRADEGRRAGAFDSYRQELAAPPDRKPVAPTPRSTASTMPTLFSNPLFDMDLASRTYGKHGTKDTRANDAHDKTVTGVKKATEDTRNLGNTGPKTPYGLQGYDVQGKPDLGRVSLGVDKSKAKATEGGSTTDSKPYLQRLRVANTTFAFVKNSVNRHYLDFAFTLGEHMTLLGHEVSRLMMALEHYSSDFTMSDDEAQALGQWLTKFEAKLKEATAMLCGNEVMALQPGDLKPRLLVVDAAIFLLNNEAGGLVNRMELRINADKAKKTSRLREPTTQSRPSFGRLGGSLAPALPTRPAQPGRHKVVSKNMRDPGVLARQEQELKRLRTNLEGVIDFLDRNRAGYPIPDMVGVISSFDGVLAGVCTVMDETWTRGGPGWVDDLVIRDINDRLDDICLRSGAADIFSQAPLARGKGAIYALADSDNLDSLRSCAAVLQPILDAHRMKS